MAVHKFNVYIYIGHRSRCYTRVSTPRYLRMWQFHKTLGVANAATLLPWRQFYSSVCGEVEDDDDAILAKEDDDEDEVTIGGGCAARSSDVAGCDVCVAPRRLARLARCLGLVFAGGGRARGTISKIGGGIRRNLRARHCAVPRRGSAIP